MIRVALEVELIEVDHHTRKPIPGRILETKVESYDIDLEDLDSSLRKALPDIDLAARKAVASRRVDYDMFSSDSAYMDMIDKVAGDYYTSSVRLADAVRRTYVVEGVYPGEGGLWSDDVEAANSDEARFQAAWTMCENDFGTVERRVGPGASPEQAIEELLEGMESQRIESVEIATPSVESAFGALETLASAAKAAGLSDPAVEQAESLMAARRAALAADDLIVFVDASEADECGPRP